MTKKNTVRAQATGAHDAAGSSTGAASVELPGGNRPAAVDQAAELPEAPAAVDAWLNLGGVENQDSVTIYRQPETGAAEFLFTVPAETPPDAMLRRLQREYGPGQYRFQVRQGGRIVRNSLVPIAAEPKPRDERAPPREPEPRRIDLTELLPQLNAQQQMTTSVITAALGRPLPPERQGPDVAKVLGAAAPLVAPIIAGIVELMKGTKPDPIELVRKFAEIREMLTADAPPPGNAGAMDVVLEGLKSLGPVVMQAMQQQAARPPMPPPMRPAPAPIAAPPAGPAPTPPEPPPVVTRQQLPPGHPLLVILGLLVNGAVKGSDPEEYTGLVLDAWPMPAEQLYALLQAPDWLQALAQFDPRAAAHAPWFEGLRASLLASFEEEGGDDAGGEGQGAAAAGEAA
jgi:hypothetical protein